METLIDAQTAAVTTDPITVDYNNSITVVAHGLGTGEEIGIEIQYADDGWETVYDRNTGVAMVMTSISNMLLIHSPGIFRFVKPVTSVAVTLSYHQRRSGL